jgi:hypothetical protein
MTRRKVGFQMHNFLNFYRASFFKAQFFSFIPKALFILCDFCFISKLSEKKNNLLGVI